jgi:hypothetical protein
MIKKSSLSDWLILWTWKALLGEIYPEIRAIALRFSKSRELTIRYYLDRNPKDDDYESISNVATNILANTSSNNEITAIKEEAIYIQGRIRDLDILDGLIYARKEY